MSSIPMDFTHSGQGFETICKELGIKILRIFLKCSYRQTFCPLDSLSVRTIFSSKIAGEAGLFASCIQTWDNYNAG